MTRALRLLVTRAADDAAAWSRELKALGHEPIELPCLSIEELPPPADVAARAREADWLVFSSARSVGHWSALCVASDARCAAVGERTAAELRSKGWRCDLQAEPQTGAGLADSLAARWDEERRPRWRLLAPGAAEGDRSLEQLAARTGWRVDRVALYRTNPATAREPRLSLAELQLDAVLLASPSAVDGLAAQADVPAGLPLACIGATTAQAAARFAQARVLESRSASLAGLVATLRPLSPA